MFDKKHREVLIFFMFLRLCGFPIARVVPGALPSYILPDKIMSSFERCGKADYVSDRLQRVMNHPLSLAEWCRISFRRALPPHSTPVVMRLNLPPPLKRFISMEHEVMKLLELERASFDKYEEEGTWEASLAVDSEEDIEHVIQALR
ncbi:unnamed protein product [Cyprideis torosa]|uniref:Uncharacterized protein n=1 Tax=Cyprideis torosa TaxID=163714 RepID=A0A7R8ZV71_9CRUS|nr:unnamed protein product [Cyprideis torosa]CAG0907092.1 unnamed protein product [Cyprideis torosa]